MVLIPAVLAGYAAGTLMALFLDRMYTRAPIRRRPALCGRHRLPTAAWLGTAGFLLLRGRCAGGCRLPARLWYLPMLGAAGAAAIAGLAVDTRQALLTGVFGVVLLAFVGTDLERHLLPNRLMYPALAAAAALCWAWPGRSAVNSIEGGLLGAAVMFVLFSLLPGFGFGDVKLAALLGLLVGVANVMPALMIGAIAGGAGALVMIAFRRAGVRSSIAYGPYLALGAFVVMLGR